MLTTEQVNFFIEHGFLILKNAAEADFITQLREETNKQLEQKQEPLELEVALQYPGAPKSIDDEGGDTIRRLRQMYDRHELYRSWAENHLIITSIQQILQCDHLYLNPNHHNSMMTKTPRFSSQTNWHRDTRYWHFNNKYLINSWLALGPERSKNGGLLILPGSHRWDDGSFVLDEQQFLIADHPANKSRLSLARMVELEAGDCLLFSAHCFHAAAQNKTQKMKQSLVFTYHGDKTYALPLTSSDEKKPIKVL